jgi:hypothetical protein
VHLTAGLPYAVVVRPLARCRHGGCLPTSHEVVASRIRVDYTSARPTLFCASGATGPVEADRIRDGSIWIDGGR